MNQSLRFHTVHGENIQLTRNMTIAKRVDSFCKGITFSDRNIAIREKIFIHLVTKAVQWTGFLRIGVTTVDPNTHRTNPNSLPRHACPDLTCRPGYWAKCVPENCFDTTTRITYFYVTEDGDLFLNTPTGEISLLTGIAVREPLWALFDVYGNTISIEIVEDPNRPASSVYDQLKQLYPQYAYDQQQRHFQEYQSIVQPSEFLPTHGPSITLFGNTNRSIAILENPQSTDGIVFLPEPLAVNSAYLFQILYVNNSTTRSTSTLQLGLTNVNTTRLQQSDLPRDIDQLINRSEYWILNDLIKVKPFERNDAYLFTLTSDGIVQISHNSSLLQDFIHIDKTLSLYPFLVLKQDVLAIRLIGKIKNIEKLRARQQELSSSNFSPVSLNRQLSNASTSETKSIRLPQDCVVCLDRLIDTVLIPCGHLCLCFQCATAMHDKGNKTCPICRTTSTLCNRIYLV
ncbi:unnamed protein product [Didymodactylos carnosus]|uniref:RING-type domain-containing protein n=1 Tax=Didymodactylos carnosus TaxID=1234261 RepID=A0A814JWS7_9BILA|nr:unnamed protein product [Didymodactylos carnosus]CAF1488177.1 unnamed protein product [Didymodactylos carnosus]CAF3813621.1 unnamed protein product [Didymodactylos carnosus]CAF4277613.1 unnamed protein product [Didymodactylos carnosus]